MKKLSIFVILLGVLSSCKTTEANYRAAYEKTVAARENAETETIYGAERRSLSEKAVIVGNDTIPVYIEHVSVVTRGDEAPADVKAYSVVAGRFKQKFNAFSLRDRLAAAGYADAAVLQTAEPYYYIIVSSHDKATEAKAALTSLKKKEPVVMSEPLPFILYNPRK